MLGRISAYGEGKQRIDSAFFDLKRLNLTGWYLKRLSEIKEKIRKHWCKKLASAKLMEIVAI